MQLKHEERKKKQENFTKDKKDTYMYIKIKLMSTFTNMGDIYNNAWTEIHLCIQEFVYEKQLFTIEKISVNIHVGKNNIKLFNITCILYITILHVETYQGYIGHSIVFECTMFLKNSVIRQP